MHPPTLSAKLERLSDWLFNCQVRMFAENYFDDDFREIFDEIFRLHCSVIDAICEEKIKELQCENARKSLCQITI